MVQCWLHIFIKYVFLCFSNFLFVVYTFSTKNCPVMMSQANNKIKSCSKFSPEHVYSIFLESTHWLLLAYFVAMIHSWARESIFGISRLSLGCIEKKYFFLVFSPSSNPITGAKLLLGKKFQKGPKMTKKWPKKKFRGYLCPRDPPILTPHSILPQP